METDREKRRGGGEEEATFISSSLSFFSMSFSVCVCLFLLCPLSFCRTKGVLGFQRVKEKRNVDSFSCSFFLFFFFGFICLFLTVSLRRNGKISRESHGSCKCIEQTSLEGKERIMIVTLGNSVFFLLSIDRCVQSDLASSPDKRRMVVE